jgi:hypothetical protein
MKIVKSTDLSRVDFDQCDDCCDICDVCEGGYRAYSLAVSELEEAEAEAEALEVAELAAAGLDPNGRPIITDAELLASATAVSVAVAERMGCRPQAVVDAIVDNRKTGGTAWVGVCESDDAVSFGCRCVAAYARHNLTAYDIGVASTSFDREDDRRAHTAEGLRSLRS